VVGRGVPAALVATPAPQVQTQASALSTAATVTPAYKVARQPRMTRQVVGALARQSRTRIRDAAASYPRGGALLSAEGRWVEVVWTVVEVGFEARNRRLCPLLFSLSFKLKKLWIQLDQHSEVIDSV